MNSFNLLVTDISNKSSLIAFINNKFFKNNFLII